ncbi:CHRD domain-containing protein [Ornithinimicrobium cryptoxanthini]|uniref:CHRD domain-containing protein n=1 Tax=Ornithinimicrobium cryptoxanthini TaxID=2934161 RepID=A0ABY4YGK1_9MICO|nr:CHRD domain-containing protein [Ornithinimicrobium cryptoxanthini]USQ75894.1 CHRD domain-containing protein [Ornithinimicrobium cryptoxanthini]
MRTTRTRLAPLAIAALVGLPFLAAAPASADDHSGTELSGTLTELNDSGASGTAWGMLEGNELHVILETQGLLDGAPHAQHIHIGGMNMCPGADVEGTGPNGELQTSDGVPSYGGVALSLTNEPGMTSGEHALDVANFPAMGSYTYERTIEVDDATAADIAEGNGVVVVHGVDHNGSGTYDGDAMSDLDPALPAEATNPALCGVFEVAQMSMPEDGVATGGASTAGTEHTGILALGALTLAVGGLGLAGTRRRAGERG